MARIDPGTGSASGTTDDPETQDEQEDDSARMRTRRLRRDARSDPVEDQTEPVDLDEEQRRVQEAQRAARSGETIDPGGGAAHDRAGGSAGGAGSGPPEGSGQGGSRREPHTKRAPPLASDERIRELNEAAAERDQASTTTRYPTEGRRAPRSSEERRARNTLTEQHELIDEGDVVFVERDGRTVATVDRDTARTLGGVGFQQGEEFIEEGGRVGETGGGEDLPVASGGQTPSQRRDAVESEIEEDIEAQVGAQRAERAGIVNPTLRDAVVENTDLVEGEDFTITRTETDKGVTISAALTEEFAVEEAERAFEPGLEASTGLDLEVGEDFRVVETEEGGYRPELTTAGEDRDATAALSGAIGPTTDYEPPATLDSFAFRGERENPIQGPLAQGITESRDFGSYIDAISLATERPIRGPGGSAGDQRILEPTGLEQTATVGELLDRASESIRGHIDVDEFRGDVPDRPTGSAQFLEDLPDRSITPGERRRQRLTRLSVESVAETPAFLVEGADFLTDAADLGIYATTEAEGEDLDRLTRDVPQAGVNAAAVGASRAIEDPVATSAQVAGSLAGTAALFGGAAALSSRAGLATRLAIQPGEEVLGIGGHGITRRLAGESRAQQLFPNREPLIFSEEVAIRAGRGLASRAGPPVRAAGRRGRVEAKSARFRLAEALSSDVETRWPTDRGQVDLAPPILRGRSGLEAETGPELDVGQSDLEVGPTPLEIGRELETGRSDLDARGELEGGTRRLETAMQPALDTQGLAAELGLGLETDLARDVVGLDLERGRSDLEQRGELATDLAVELGMETRAEGAVEQRGELELETELETASELETELFDLRPSRQPRRRDEREFSGRSRILVRSLLNPFTGR